MSGMPFVWQGRIGQTAAARRFMHCALLGGEAIDGYVAVHRG
ncbi:hypothetical protein [Paenibacillus pinisoli]|nr:hypothetical protein [Paenibacillus pinisoli]